MSYGSATLADAVRHRTGTGHHDVIGYLHVDKNAAHLATGTIVEQGGHARHHLCDLVLLGGNYGLRGPVAW